MKRFAVALLLPLVFAGNALAAGPSRLPACASAQSRQLDFWIGHWVVRDTASGVAIGRSRIEPLLGGCAMAETFDQDVGPGSRPIDYHGASHSAYDTTSGAWRQFYVGTDGTSFLASGGIADGAMVLEASTDAVSRRMTLRAMPDGRVRQTGETTRDGGKTWQTSYDFTYERETMEGTALTR